MKSLAAFYSAMKHITGLLLCGAVVVPLVGCQGKLMTAARGWQMVPDILQQIVPPTFAEKDYRITDFGAVGNGQTDCTQAFQEAIAACHAGGGGRVVVAAGTYLTGAIHLKSNVNLHLEKDAVISFFTNTEDYLPLVFTRFKGVECLNYSPLVYALDQENISITGSGTLDGNANSTNWTQWKRLEKADLDRLLKQARKHLPVEARVYGPGHHLRPSMIQLYRCKNILIEGVTVKNSPLWHIHPVLSQNITIRNVSVIGYNQNNDGCDPESCRDVLIENCFFDTGDDCVAIKSGRNDDGRRINVPSENIVIRNCTMKEGHGGVVIGSEISGGARNIFAENCLIDSPNQERGLRLKSNSVRGGVIENIFMRDVIINQVKEAALLIDYYYEEGDTGPFDPVMRNIFMTNVRCGKSKYPWLIRGYERCPVRNVVLENCVFETMEQEGIAEAVEGFTVR